MSGSPARAAAPRGAAVRRRRAALAVAAGAALWLACSGAGAPAAVPAAPQPASGLDATAPHDPAGRRIVLRWSLSPDDAPGRGAVSGYLLERAARPVGPWRTIDSVGAGVDSLVDATVARDRAYFYRVTATGPGGRTPAGACAGPAVARAAWYYPTRQRVLVAAALLLGLLLYLYGLRSRPAGGGA